MLAAGSAFDRSSLVSLVVDRISRTWCQCVLGCGLTLGGIVLHTMISHFGFQNKTLSPMPVRFQTELDSVNLGPAYVPLWALCTGVPCALYSDIKCMLHWACPCVLHFGSGSSHVFNQGTVALGLPMRTSPGHRVYLCMNLHSYLADS